MRAGCAQSPESETARDDVFAPLALRPQILESIEIDYIDESEVLTMADEENHINKNKFTVPFVCGCRNLGEALRRIAEGATMLRTKGEKLESVPWVGRGW